MKRKSLGDIAIWTEIFPDLSERKNERIDFQFSFQIRMTLIN